MRMARTFLLFGALAFGAVAACGPTEGSTMDSGGGGGDASTMETSTPREGGTGTEAGREGGTGTEGGTNPSDRCSATSDNPASTVGCNGGFVMGDPAANAAGGLCTPRMNGMEYTNGSCTDMMAFCVPGDMQTMGRCFNNCTSTATYVSTGGCPSGFRCFGMGDGMAGTCYRDCDMTHPCPTGQECDEEGSCVPTSGG